MAGLFLTANCCNHSTQRCSVRTPTTIRCSILQHWSSSGIKCAEQQGQHIPPLFLFMYQTVSGKTANQFWDWRELNCSKPLTWTWSLQHVVSIHHRWANLKALFHYKGTVRLGIPVVGFAWVIPTMKKLGDWAVPQQSNEPRPIQPPCVITYSIKFSVCSLVIVMNMQAVNLLVSQMKETLGGWQSVWVDWIPGCCGAHWWRLMSCEEGQSVLDAAFLAMLHHCETPLEKDASSNHLDAAWGVEEARTKTVLTSWHTRQSTWN